MTCYIFRQDNPPTNWDQNRFGDWEPANIMLVTDIPSKHSSNKKYKVLLMYVPTSLPVQHDWMGYRQPATRRIKAICCGPSQGNACPVGARTVAPCSHGTTVLFAGCCQAYDPQAFRTTHRNVNIIDPGNRLPLQYGADLVAGTIG